MPVVLNEDGSSLANWTGEIGAGAWSTDGTKFIGRDTPPDTTAIVQNVDIFGFSDFSLQMTVEFPTSPDGFTAPRLGIRPLSTDPFAGEAWFVIFGRRTTGDWNFTASTGLEVLNEPIAVDFDEAHVYRIDVAGSDATAFLDGVEIGSWSFAGTPPYNLELDMLSDFVSGFEEVAWVTDITVTVPVLAALAPTIDVSATLAGTVLDPPLRIAATVDVSATLAAVVVIAPEVGVLTMTTTLHRLGVSLDVDPVVIDIEPGAVTSPTPSGYAPPIPFDVPLPAEVLPPTPTEEPLPLPPWTERGDGVPYRVD